MSEGRRWSHCNSIRNVYSNFRIDFRAGLVFVKIVRCILVTVGARLDSRVSDQFLVHGDVIADQFEAARLDS